ncbi:hypothetical protein KQX54_001297 [Cotesia glomerata]|uniref:Uncharacterized protein n=1 Tax=Cotesia glomerata TaxID=32391 RepID=A0AAV7IH04_COTGL|nr:hypothetical protein KQX54_001297 [Cotesia glomerata]
MKGVHRSDVGVDQGKKEAKEDFAFEGISRPRRTTEQATVGSLSKNKVYVTIQEADNRQNGVQYCLKNKIKTGVIKYRKEESRKLKVGSISRPSPKFWPDVFGIHMCFTQLFPKLLHESRLRDSSGLVGHPVDDPMRIPDGWIAG